MSLFINKFFLVIGIFCLSLTTVACGAREAEKDIQPPEALQPQATPETSPTPEPAATATNLPTELVEPLSPISPTLPQKEATMAIIGTAVKPIPGSEKALAAAIADLAKQTGLPAGDIHLASIEAVNWSDASLGCPQEGFMYAQVITPGYLIMLEAQGQQYEYHADQAATNVIQCKK